MLGLPIAFAQYNPRIIGVGLGVQPVTTLTDGPVITINCDATKFQQHNKVTLGGNRDLIISGATNGMTGNLLIYQDSTGSRSISLPVGSKILPGGNATLMISGVPGAVNSLNWLYDGTNFIWSQDTSASGVGSGTVTSIDASGGTTGLAFTGGPITSTGLLTLSGILNKINGGTGTANASLVNGTNIAVSGVWPNQTINVTGVIPISLGGNGTIAPALAAGSGISITGTWPNQVISATGVGAGDVTGPNGATDSQSALFSLATGKVLKASTLTGLIKETIGVPTVAVAGTDYGRIDSISLAVPSSLFTTPVNWTRLGSAASATLTYATQTAGTVFAGPATGSAAVPLFRALVNSDLPTNVSYDVVQTIGDVRTATINNATNIIKFTTILTGPTVLTLPLASANTKIKFTDAVGVATTANTISIARAGSDTINGASINVQIANGNYLKSEVASDGTSKWATQYISTAALLGTGANYSGATPVDITGGVISIKPNPLIVGDANSIIPVGRVQVIHNVPYSITRTDTLPPATSFAVGGAIRLIYNVGVLDSFGGLLAPYAGDTINSTVNQLSITAPTGGATIRILFSDGVSNWTVADVSDLGSSISESEMSITDNSLQNVTTSAHGFTPKLDGNSSHYLNGIGQQNVPAPIPRTLSIVSSSTPAINTDLYEAVTITNLAVPITSFTTSLLGTPPNFKSLEIRIHDNGTPQTLAWGSAFSDGAVSLPTVTTANTALYVKFSRNSEVAKWICMQSSNTTSGTPTPTPTATPTPTPGTYLVQEDAEGTGSPTGWVNNGTPNWDYTTTVLEGTQSWAASVNGDTSFIPFAPQTDCWVYLLEQQPTVLFTGSSRLLQLRDGSGVEIAGLRFLNTGAIRIYQGTATAASTGGYFTTSTVLSLWIHYIAGSGLGSNGVIELYISNSPVRPASPAVTVTAGTSTVPAEGFIMAGFGTGALVTDHIRVSSTSIGSNPP